MRTLEFGDFESALHVFNYHGERRSQRFNGRKIQDYFFTVRRSVTHGNTEMHHDMCTRCFHDLPRHGITYVDVAKRHADADKLCQDCLAFVMRRDLGYDEDLIGREARRLITVQWSPLINVELAGKKNLRRENSSLLEIINVI